MWSGLGDEIGYGAAGTPEDAISTGAGDPFLSVLTGEDIRLYPSNLVWEFLEEGSTRSREAEALVFSQTGGELIDLAVPVGRTWPAGVYRIRLISVLDQIFPHDKPACFGAVEGAGPDIQPLYANTVLRFALPRAPIGVYDILVTDNTGRTLRILRAIRLAPASTSLEVNRYRTFFNPEVYSKRGPAT
jgi:hypothetical protein